jgi:formylglycine-generating enzyme required for sulfatase activity
MTAYRVKERPSSVTEILQVVQPVINFNPNQTKVQSQSKPNPQIVIPQPVPQNPRQAQFQVSEFEFEYVKTRLVTESSGFLGLGTKTQVELDRKRSKSQYIRENIGNGVEIELVQIPAGKFMMGESSAAHAVYLQEFWMGKYVVTQKQWQAVMGNNPANFKGENLPVELVSWHDVMDFCEKVSKSTEKKFRLPTEAEWEYACRAGTNTPFHCGETITTNLVNYDGSRPYGKAPKGQYRQKTVDVDSFYPNQWGLYQMHGNVWEWCLDDWHDNYSAKPVRLKQNGNEPWGDVNTSKNGNCSHVVRGGAWIYNAGSCRSDYRNHLDAVIRHSDLCFRVVLLSSVS